MSLKHAITDYAHTALQSPKVAANVGLGTIVMGTFKDWIDGIMSYLGTGAVSIGAILSIVLIFNNIKGGIIKRKLLLEELKMAKLQEEKAVMEKEILRRELEKVNGKDV